MPEIYADEDLNGALVRRLRARGYDVLRAIDVKPAGTLDHEHLMVATDTGRLLITHNHDDFWHLHRAWHARARHWSVQPSPMHSGILAVPRKHDLAIDMTADFIDQLVTSEPSLSNTHHRLIAKPQPFWQRDPVGSSQGQLQLPC